MRNTREAFRISLRGLFYLVTLSSVASAFVVNWPEIYMIMKYGTPVSTNKVTILAVNDDKFIFDVDGTTVITEESEALQLATLGLHPLASECGSEPDALRVWQCWGSQESFVIQIENELLHAERLSVGGETNGVER